MFKPQMMIFALLLGACGGPSDSYRQQSGIPLLVSQTFDAFSNRTAVRAAVMNNNRSYDFYSDYLDPQGCIELAPAELIVGQVKTGKRGGYTARGAINLLNKGEVGIDIGKIDAADVYLQDPKGNIVLLKRGLDISKKSTMQCDYDSYKTFGSIYNKFSISSRSEGVTSQLCGSLEQVQQARHNNKLTDSNQDQWLVEHKRIKALSKELLENWAIVVLLHGPKGEQLALPGLVGAEAVDTASPSCN